MEFSLQPLGFMEFLQNNNHQTVNKMKSNIHTHTHTYIYIYIYIYIYTEVLLETNCVILVKLCIQYA